MALRVLNSVARTEVNQTNNWHALTGTASDADVSAWLATHGGAPGINVSTWAAENPAGSAIWHATTYGVGDDNPVAPDDMPGFVLTQQQRARSLAVWLEGNATHPLTSFQIRYSITACCTTGRNFLFAGLSNSFIPPCDPPPPPPPMPVAPPLPPPPAAPVTCANMGTRTFEDPPCVMPYPTAASMSAAAGDAPGSGPCMCTPATVTTAPGFCIAPNDVTNLEVNPTGASCGSCDDYLTPDSCYVYASTSGGNYWGLPWESAARCMQKCHPTACVSLDCYFLGSRDFPTVDSDYGACGDWYTTRLHPLLRLVAPPTPHRPVKHKSYP